MKKPRSKQPQSSRLNKQHTNHPLNTVSSLKLPGWGVTRDSLRKQAYSNILKILPPKN